MERKLRAAFAEGQLPGLHSVLVLHRGETFAEVYFPGEDERWGSPLGHRAHGPETLHDLRSVTKSILGLLYGIALAEGKVPGLNTSLLDQFPEYADLAQDPARRAITIADTLTMRMGTEWDETPPYTDPRNSEIAMEQAEDRYRFVLDRPMVVPPGTRWSYNGGATAVIGRLIARGTGRSLDTYAKEKLFDPLGITEFDWIEGADGVPSAASGLRLRARDLAKIGQMIVDGGKAGGRQIVPADWLAASFTAHADTGEYLRYGLFWWLAPEGDPPHWVAGLGNGGQRLSVSRAGGLVVVILAGNYNQPDAWRIPVKVIQEFLSPALDRS